jgi:glycosyltransferase involved in cell wall biosynthesis
MDESGVSFVITVYNKQDALEACARSMLGQQGAFKREYIFVDDGSTDGSPALLARLAQENPDVRVIRQANAGPARALNAGVREASYAIIKPMDADDILAHDGVLRLLPGLQGGRAMALGKKVVLDAKNNPDAIQRQGPPAFADIPDLLRTAIDISQAGCSEVVFFRDAFLQAGGCDERLFVQDQSYILRLAAQGRVIAKSEEVVVFSPPSDSRSLSQNPFQANHDNNAGLMYLFEDYPHLSPALKRLALKKSASRAWKWAVRVEKRFRLLERCYWIYLMSRLPFAPTGAWAFRPTLQPFRRTHPVRIP